jgi:16S rRNA (cytosine967-C5)-methyltransferase
VNARRVAFRLLRSGTPAPLRQVGPESERAGLDGRDRGLVRHLVATHLRRLGTWRAILAALGRVESRRAPKPEVALAAQLGFVQLLHSERIPDHAAVAETIRLAREELGEPQARAVGAILERVTKHRREGASGNPRRDLVGAPWHLDFDWARDPVQHPHLWVEDALSLPAALAKRWSDRHGEDVARKLALEAMEDPPLSLRVSGVAPDLDGAVERLAALGVEPIARDFEAGVLLVPASAAAAVLGDENFALGRWTVQGATAARAARLLEAAPGERLLDLCAAPGGKAAVLAEAGADVLALDTLTRLERARETARRLGLAGDGSGGGRIRFAAALDGRGVRAAAFDGVLVDAPCSNTGVLSARPEARWRFGPAALASLAEVQDRLLDAAARAVRPRGRIVYATCSIEPSENAARVRAFLARHPGFELEQSFEALPDHHSGPADGGYAARLRAPAGV